MENSIEELKRMVENLPDLSELIRHRDGTVEYEVNGTAIGFGLWKQQEIAVQRVFSSKGSKFPMHTHREHEFILVYKGKLRVVCEECDFLGVPWGELGVVAIAQGVYFPPGSAHSVVALEDTWRVSITIPAAEGYPNG